MGFNITNENYAHYKKVFEIIWNCHQKYFPSLSSDSESSPINVLNRFENKSMSMAKKSLKMGISDSLMMIKEYPKHMLEEIEKEFATTGLPTIRQMRAEISDSIAKVLTRKKIRNEEEYYIVKEIVDDIDSDYNEDERQILEACMADFENKITKRNK